jgi:L-rhamnonate dehydratase
LKPDHTNLESLIRDIRVHEFTSKVDPQHIAQFVEVVADSGESGWSGSIYPEMGAVIHNLLRPRLIGRAALAYEANWDVMKLADRHSRAGLYMMALSAVDIALWDLQGKMLNLPVYRLLGGPTREHVPVYASMLGHSTEPDQARFVARKFFDDGFTTQKWFFDFTPQDGSEGFKRNLELVRTLREELGTGAELMFDCKWAWDVPYTIQFGRAIREYAVKWVEEPLRPENIEGYAAIKRDGGVPLAAGEHLYSRWEVKPYLERGILDYLQTDPEWCGGITELVKICSMAETYGVPVFPHGHHIWAASHVIASRPVRVSPMAEYLFHYMPEKLHFMTPQISPVKGMLALPTTPGLGFSIDETKIANRRILTY